MAFLDKLFAKKKQTNTESDSTQPTAAVAESVEQTIEEPTQAPTEEPIAEPIEESAEETVEEETAKEEMPETTAQDKTQNLENDVLDSVEKIDITTEVDNKVKLEENTELIEVNTFENYKSYDVKKGDTLRSISRKFFGTDEMASSIKELNGISNGNLIKVGQTLMIPEAY